MPQMLRHVKTGEIWPMNPNLARHPDVEIFNKPDEQFEQAAAAAAEAVDVDEPTIGDLAQAEVQPAEANPEMMEPVFEDVPDYVAPDEDDEEAAAAAAAEAEKAQKKAAAAAKRKATLARKKQEAEAKAKAKAEAAAKSDDDDDFDLLDDLDELDD